MAPHGPSPPEARPEYLRNLVARRALDRELGADWRRWSRNFRAECRARIRCDGQWERGGAIGDLGLGAGNDRPDRHVGDGASFFLDAGVLLPYGGVLAGGTLAAAGGLLLATNNSANALDGPVGGISCNMPEALTFLS